MKKWILGIAMGMFIVTSGVIAQADDGVVPKEDWMIPKVSEMFEKSPNQKNDATFFGNSATHMRDYTGTSSGAALSAGDQFRNTLAALVTWFKKLLIPIAIMLLVYAGFELMVSRGDEEKFKKKKEQVYGMGIGFGLIAWAAQLVDWVFFGQLGGIFREDGEGSVAFASRGAIEMEGIFNYLSTFVVVIAVAFIVFNALTLVLAGGEDEGQLDKIKKRVVYSISGVAIIISVRLMKAAFTEVDGRLRMADVGDLITILAKWGNFILGFIGVLAVVGLIWGGVRLIFSFGDESATGGAKKVVLASAIGLILSFSAWTIIRFVVVPEVMV